MRKIFKLYMLLLPLALLANGCNDWLDVKPQSQVESDDLFTAEKGFEDALMSCYIKMDKTDLYGQNMTMTFIEYLAQHWDFSSGNDNDEAPVKNFEYTTDYAESTISSIYGAFYNTIVQANSVLENLAVNGEVITHENIRNIIEAEALSIRAFCHFDVLRMFGQLPQNATIAVQLPYAKEVTTSTIPYYSYDQFVNIILEDLAMAQDLFAKSDPVLDYTFEELDYFTNIDYGVEIEDDFLGYRRFRFNYWAVEALKARIYLYIGDKENARIAANNVINAQTTSGKPILALATDADFRSGYYTCPSECILALSCNNMEDYINGLFSYEKRKLTTSHMNDLFAGQSLSVNNRARYVWEKTVNIQGMEYYALKKYNQPDQDDIPMDAINSLMLRYQVIPLIRLSEMYLIAMECAPSLAEANALYKTYMQARSVTVADLNQSQMDEEILKEYRREFWAEGQMFYTYKRLGVSEMLWKTDREVTEKDYIVPLPSSELGY